MMKMPVLFVALLAAAMLTVAANSQEGASPTTAKAETDSKVKELQQQRIATLKEIVEGLNVQRQSGRGSFEETLEATVQLLNAELEVATNDAERIKICENIVKQFATLEEVAQAAREGARGTYTAVLKAKAKRLEAEIVLERMKGRGAK